MTTRKNANRAKGMILAGLAAILGTGTLTSCSSHYTDPSMVALRYAGGPTEGGKFKECVKPGTKQVSNDSYYDYPTTQREDVWDSDNYGKKGSKSADHKDMEVVDKDGNVAYLKVKVSFYLNTECSVLRKFHETIGRTRRAYFNNDGTYGNGWVWAMDNYISSAVQQQAKYAAINDTVDDIWLKPATQDSIATAIQTNIQKAVDDGMQGSEEFYKDFSVRVYGGAPSPDFMALYTERKAAQVKADTAEANKQAQIAEAKAQAGVAKQQAKVQQAQIAGYPSVDAYLKAQAIAKGMNPFVPQYVVGTTPAGSN